MVNSEVTGKDDDRRGRQGWQCSQVKSSVAVTSGRALTTAHPASAPTHGGPGFVSIDDIAQQTACEETKPSES